MNWHSRALGAVLIAAMLAACSGGGGSTSSTMPAGNAPTFTGKTGKLKMILHVPTKHRMAKLLPHLAKSYEQAKSGRKGHFIGSATTEIDFTMTASTAATPGPAWNNTIYTGTSTCNTDTCTVLFEAPAATDTYSVEAQWCSSDTDAACPDGATLTLISKGDFTVTVPDGGTASADLTLDPVVGQLALSTDSGLGTGSSAPTIVNGAYSCPSGEQCYDPLLNNATPGASSSYYGLAATPTYDSLNFTIEDAAGDEIVPAFSTQYNSTILLTAAGTPDDVTLSCSGSPSDVQIVNYDAPNPDPSPVPQGDLGNGYTGSGYPAINTPMSYYSEDGTSITDSLGNTVTAAGNNIYAVNFDGGSGSYTTSSLYTCQAQDSSSTPIVSPTIYIGLGFGNVAVIDGRHRPHHSRRR